MVLGCFAQFLEFDLWSDYDIRRPFQGRHTHCLSHTHSGAVTLSTSIVLVMRSLPSPKKRYFSSLQELRQTIRSVLCFRFAFKLQSTVATARLPAPLECRMATNTITAGVFDFHRFFLLLCSHFFPFSFLSLFFSLSFSFLFSFCENFL